ncbi:MAG: ArdC-like ssDNA-binding domain-containing protein [Acidimicrobiales bacterium]
MVIDRSALVGRLVEGVARLAGTEEWRRHLDVQARFTTYSFGNVMLIADQCPQATRVAGFRAWQRMGRTVRRGERAIWILAPVVGRNKGDDGEPSQRVVRGFRHVPVFDVSQTEGEDLPTVCSRLEGDDPHGVYEGLVAAAASLGFAVEDASLPPGVNGDCSHDLRRIRVEAANRPAQRVKTLAHEMAHAVLHADFSDRPLAELEAESTAYVVCQAVGLETGDYSFGYVATWAGGGDAAVAGIRASGERIQLAADRVLAALATPGCGEH